MEAAMSGTQHHTASAKVFCDANAGHSANTAWKAYSDRPYCVAFGSDYLRDKAGRVRRFGSFASATAAAQGGAA